MKTVTQLLMVTFVAVFLASCGASQSDMTIKSPEGNITVTLKAAKPTSLDPYDVTMNIAGYGKDRSLTFDMYNSEFNNKTVVAEFSDENKFVITFKQSDGDNRVMDVFLSAEEIRLQER